MWPTLVPAGPLAQRQPIPARELVAQLVKVALPRLGLVIAMLGSMLRSAPSPPDSSVNRVTDGMAGGARSLSGSGKLSMNGTTGAVSVEPGSREPPDNSLIAFSKEPRTYTQPENASIEVTGST